MPFNIPLQNPALGLSPRLAAVAGRTELRSLPSVQLRLWAKVCNDKLVLRGVPRILYAPFTAKKCECASLYDGIGLRRRWRGELPLLQGLLQLLLLQPHDARSKVGSVTANAGCSDHNTETVASMWTVSASALNAQQTTKSGYANPLLVNQDHVCEEEAVVVRETVREHEQSCCVDCAKENRSGVVGSGTYSRQATERLLV